MREAEEEKPIRRMLQIVCVYMAIRTYTSVSRRLKIRGFQGR